MNIMEVLRQTGGVEAIASQLGIPPEMAEAGAAALLPAVVGGFQKQAEPAGTAGGLGGLIDVLGGLGGGGLATNVLGPEPTQVEKGNDILGQIFGSKDVSRTIAGHAAGETGIDPSILKKMLPILAMLVAGYLSTRAQGDSSEGGAFGGGLGSILASVLGGGQPQQSQGGLLGSLGGLLDLNHDGNPLDDIIGMAGKLAR